jgi:hypothetical protein
MALKQHLQSLARVVVHRESHVELKLFEQLSEETARRGAVQAALLRLDEDVALG